MPRYLVQASYTPQGLEGVLAKGGTARREAIEAMLAEVGGKVETFDFASKIHDLHYCISDIGFKTIGEHTEDVLGEAGLAGKLERLHEELGVRLAYPNYRAGLEGILAAER